MCRRRAKPVSTLAVAGTSPAILGVSSRLMGLAPVHELASASVQNYLFECTSSSIRTAMLRQAKNRPVLGIAPSLLRPLCAWHTLGTPLPHIWNFLAHATSYTPIINDR